MSILAASILGSGTGSPASAASTKDRLRALEATVGQLQSRLDADGGASSVRIGQLESQVADLTGQIEELEFKLREANARLSAVSSVLAADPAFAGQLPADALADVASGPAAVGGPVSLTPGGDAFADPIADRIAEEADPGNAAASSAPAASVTLPAEPDPAFDYASSFLLQGDYARARAAFEGFVDAFPNNARTSEARFRLGEIYLATGANAEAADLFIAHIRTYPNDPRAAEAYLKLGTAFSRLNQTEEACKVFRAMKSKFSNASLAVLQRADAEMARIQCR